MCGRYYSRATKQRIAEALKVGVPVPFDIVPSYNVAPQTFQPVVRLNSEGVPEMVMMRWGLIPFWAKDASIGKTTINAKAETVATKNAFREAFKKRRCLVPASGFYEWQKLSKSDKQAFAITVTGKDVIAFAGLWERWKDNTTGQPLETFSVITTDPNELMQPIHDRMPVIIAEKDYPRWLDTSDPTRPPLDLLRPFPAEKMEAWKVGKDVGNVRNNRPDLCEPQEGGLFG